MIVLLWLEIVTRRGNLLQLLIISNSLLSPLVLNAIKLDHKDAEPLPLVIRFKNAWFYLSVEQYFPKFWNDSKKVTQVILHQLTFTFDLFTSCRIVDTNWPQSASCCCWWRKIGTVAHNCFQLLQLRMSASQRFPFVRNLPISRLSTYCLKHVKTAGYQKVIRKLS